MAIYPRSTPEPQAFALAPEETVTLKKGFVFAFEEGLATQQDRALRALTLAEFTPERTIEIRNNLHQIFSLEAELESEVKQDVSTLEAAWAAGKEDPAILKIEVECKAVDATVFAQRFVQVKRGEEVADPVLPPKKVIEPLPVEPGELGEIG